MAVTYHYDADTVRRGNHELCLDVVVSESIDDNRGEGGQGVGSQVLGHEDDDIDSHAPVHQAPHQVGPTEMAMCTVAIPQHPPLRDLTLALIEPTRVVRPIWEDEDADGCYDDGKAALQDEENAPCLQAAMDVRDSVGLIQDMLSK